jgi:hypothetical protein
MFKESNMLAFIDKLVAPVFNSTNAIAMSARLVFKMLVIKIDNQKE